MRAEPGQRSGFREGRKAGVILPAQEQTMKQSVVAWHYPDGPHQGVLLLCIVTSPPSSAGRAVEVWIEADTAEALMKDLRSFAASRRQTTEAGRID